MEGARIMYICICAAITAADVLACCRAGARTAEEVAERCGAGTGCGTCFEHIDTILTATSGTERGALTCSA